VVIGAAQLEITDVMMRGSKNQTTMDLSVQTISSKNDYSNTSTNSYPRIAYPSLLSAMAATPKTPLDASASATKDPKTAFKPTPGKALNTVVVKNKGSRTVLRRTEENNSKVS